MNKSLCDKHILITRPARQGAETARLVAERGGKAVLFPCLDIHCLEHNILAASDAITAASDILFTSANGVECAARAFGSRLPELLAGKRITAVGDKTAAALKAHDIAVDLTPAEFSQEGLIALYRQAGIPHDLLFFRAEEGRDLLSDALAAAGCRTSMVAAYRTICPDDDASAIRHRIAAGQIDAVLLGSPKTARHYARRIGDLAIANIPAIVAISPLTADAAKAAGLGVQAVAKTASFDAMLDALASYFDT